MLGLPNNGFNFPIMGQHTAKSYFRVQCQLSTSNLFFLQLTLMYNFENQKDNIKKNRKIVVGRAYVRKRNEQFSFYSISDSSVHFVHRRTGAPLVAATEEEPTRFQRTPMGREAAQHGASMSVVRGTGALQYHTDTIVGSLQLAAVCVQAKICERWYP